MGGNVEQNYDSPGGWGEEKLRLSKLVVVCMKVNSRSGEMVRYQLTLFLEVYMYSIL